MPLTFVSPEHFLDPEYDVDGNLYAPIHLRELMKDKYMICQNMNISYLECGKLTSTERETIKQFIFEDLQAKQKAIEESRGEKELI